MRSLAIAFASVSAPIKLANCCNFAVASGILGIVGLPITKASFPAGAQGFAPSTFVVVDELVSVPDRGILRS